jgi:hypothetical protein
MDAHVDQVKTFLADLGARWRLLSALRAATRLTMGIAALGVATFAVWWSIGRASVMLESVIVGAAIVATLVTIGVAWRGRPTPADDRELALLAEEHLRGFDDRLVTAADVLNGTAAGASSLLREPLMADTASRIPPEGAAAVIHPTLIRAASLRLAGATALVVAFAVLLSAPALRTLRAAWIVTVPVRLAFDVQPGHARVPPATPLTIRVRTSAAGSGLVPTFVARIKDATERVRMTPDGENRFAVTFKRVTASFAYHIELANRSSNEYTVTALQPPRVSRVDLAYEFPAFTRLAPRVERDGGDVYAPEGTRVRVRVTPKTVTAPVASGSLLLRNGTAVPLSQQADGSLTGELTVSADGAYRVRLTDRDGLQNLDDPEYFVRMLDDRPPDVRIVRPASDRQVTPLEEVEIEARADDDHGIEGMELVYGLRGEKERVVPLGGNGHELSVTGRHTVFLEDLGVKPGDFVTYYARARDIGRGKRSTEARSDIYFLEVTPFVDEFALAQSQAMSAAGQPMDDLVRLQKDVIVGTWKLNRRAAGSGATPSSDDIRALGRAQGTVRQRTEAAAAQQRAGGMMIRRPGAAVDPQDDESVLGQAARAMARAEQALGAQKVAQALPAEMEALNHLLRAQSEARRKQVTRQQAGGGAGFNRAQQDLSTLFDRELQRQQQTNYETPKTAEERRGDQSDATLDRVRELARRQEALARQQDDLARDRAKLDADEVKRRLERLTREQSELRREAEMLAQQLQQSGRRPGEQANRDNQSSQGDRPQATEQGETAPTSSRGGGDQASALRDASESMRSAASDLRREDPQAARRQSARALERLQGVARALSDSGPDERRRALGDAQLEARQLADRQRQLSDSGSQASGASGEDRRRRAAGEQEQLAGRVDALGRRLRELGAAAGDRGEKQRLGEAARALESSRVGERMRELARGLQKGEDPSRGETARDLARSLDRLADQVGGAGGATPDRESRQLSDDLSKTRELRERLAELDRQMSDLRRQMPPAAGQPGKTGTSGAAQGSPGRGNQSTPDPRERQLSDLRRRYLEELQRAGDMGDQFRKVIPGTGGGGSTPTGQAMVLGAPGTEAFKQDFTKWENLHREVALGLERIEAGLSQRVMEKAARERLRSGSADRTPPEYSSSVDRYFRSLAQEPR